MQATNHPPLAADALTAGHPALADAHLANTQPSAAALAAKGESPLRRNIISLAYLVGGVFSAALGLESFMLPNGLFDGGVTGISLLAARLIHLPLSVFLVVLNLPFIWLGYRSMGKDFAIRALAAILALALVLVVVHFPSLLRIRC